MRRLAIAAAVALLAACGGGGGVERPPSIPPNPTSATASAWEIGPIISGKNYSHGLPLHPVADVGGGWHFDFPLKDGVHYVTVPTGPLTGKCCVSLRYHIDADPSVKFEPSSVPGAPSILTIYFQRCGDDWSGAGKYETYRWWSTTASISPISNGPRGLSVSFAETWFAVMGSSSGTSAQAFHDALAHACRIGFTFGGGTGYGHGVYASGPARFVLESFEVQ